MFAERYGAEGQGILWSSGLLAAAVAAAAYDISTITGLISKHQQGAGGIAKLAIGAIGQQRLVEISLKYVGVIGLLVIAWLTTRGERVWIEEDGSSDDRNVSSLDDRDER